ncbi:hypothetical protein [Fructobacillus americanaquae]|uniref:Secreted protein n=1 Tax=Fructobacillus americanaquae TaxID=2940302 RepID=A0ABY5BYZ6_9LACO|nr:hypothetical protein [Fructobacillus americanaquae]USS91734.1 hypothetical protein M3M36_05315 [Fructobacillus americanaquae]
MQAKNIFNGDITMKHGSNKNSQGLLFISVLAIVVILVVSFYFVGNANNNKDEKNSDNSSSVILSHISKSTNQQESANSTVSSSQPSFSQSHTNNNSLVYYDGQTKTTLPTTNGSIDPNENYTDGATFWPATLTINGKKENVVAMYARMGYFQIFTKEPTSKSQGFTYNGEDYNNHIGDKDLDPLASSSETIHY